VSILQANSPQGLYNFAARGINFTATKKLLAEGDVGAYDAWDSE